jgi:hypothetical protein
MTAANKISRSFAVALGMISVAAEELITQSLSPSQEWLKQKSYTTFYFQLG